jgi:oxygen-dependent protoporphyrinogen oxidase
LALSLVVAGGGISGLSLAHALSGEGGIDVTVLESLERPGGKVWSDRVGGYLCESGVNGFLDNKPRTLELSSMLSLEPLRSSDVARKRFIYSGGALHRLPESPPAFFKSGLMGLGGKLRIALEPFVAKGGSGEESLADFARRRLGTEAFEKLIDPMASGVFAGDPEALSLRSCFPVINGLEREYGSLIKAMFKLMRKRRSGVGAGPGGTLTSFRDGMQAMVDALRGSLGGALRLKSRVASLDKAGDGYTFHLSDGSSIQADAAVLATPAHQSAEILRGLEPKASAVLNEIPYPALSVVCMGFVKEKIKASLDAFGFLVPYKEGRRILGTLYDSSIFPGRAPEGRVLLRSMVGGARAPSLAELEDGKLLDTVLSELSEVAGIKAEPDFVKIYRHGKSIPQYNLGHRDRLERLDGLVSRHRGLYLTGNAYRGVSLNDCIANSLEIAGKIKEDVL